MPKYSDAPYLQRQVETNLSKLQSNLKAITENSEHAVKAKALSHGEVRRRFTCVGRSRGGGSDCGGGQLPLRPEPKPAKEIKPPPPAAKPPPAHKKTANGPRVLTFASAPYHPREPVDSAGGAACSPQPRVGAAANPPR